MDKWPRYDTPFYFHMRNLGMENSAIGSLTNGVTVCMLPMRDKHAFSAGIAVCSDKDNYCKKIGRDISLGRAKVHADAGQRLGPCPADVMVIADSYEKLADVAKSIAMRAVLERH